MFNISSFLQIDSKFKQLQKLNKNIIVTVTTSNRVIFTPCDNFQLIKEIYHSYFELYISNITFSLDGSLMAFSEDNNIHIVDTGCEQLVQTIKLDNDSVERMEFDLESRYIIFCTKLKKVYQYKYDKNYVISREFSFSKIGTISDIYFYDNMVAMGSEDGFLYITNLYSLTGKHIVKISNYKINKIYLRDKQTLLVGDDKGDIYIYNLYGMNQTKRVETGFTTISDIVFLPESDYIFVVGDSNHISIYNKNSMRLISSRYIEFYTIIEKIEVVDRYNLIILLKNGLLKKVVLQNPNILESLVVNNLLIDAFKIVEQDIILKDTKQYKIIEDSYDKVYKKAFNHLFNGDKDRAIELIEPFLIIKSKNHEIKQLFRAYQYYDRFKVIISQENYLIAYAISSKFPALQETTEFNKMENRFKIVFKKAQQLILNGEDTTDILSKFITVPQKRDTIRLMLRYNNDFITFLKAIDSDDFKTIYKKIELDESFLKIYDFKIIEDKVESILNDISLKLSVGDFEFAYKELGRFDGIDSLKDKISYLYKYCDASKELQKAYDLDNFVKCYEILDNNIILGRTELSSYLDKYWKKIIYKAENFMFNGDFKGLRGCLGELISVTTRRVKIGSLLRGCFYNQIEILRVEKKYIQSENLIYSFIDIFGLDDEILEFMRNYEALTGRDIAITQHQNLEIAEDSWIYSELIMGDLVHHRDDTTSGIIKLIN